jgi:transglutaminase-like putative cysteine protease
MRTAIPRYVGVSVAVVAAMSVIAAIGFRSALSGWSFVIPAVIAAIGASAIVLLATWRRLLFGESVALSVVGFVVLGGIAVGGLPTPDAYASFLRGMVDGWADLLSASPPTDITTQLRALPFAVAWLAAGVGGEIARHTRRPGLPAIGPIAALALSLLFTVEERSIALAQGAGILAGTLLLISVGQRFAPRVRVGRSAAAAEDILDAPPHRRRLMFGAALVIGAVVAAPVVGPRLPFAEAHERFDLRRYQEPPFDPLAVPSPLVQLKASLKDDRKEDVVFVVSGDDPIERWPVAVMSDFDGVVWTVADPERDEEAAEFVPVDTAFPDTERVLPDGTRRLEHTVEVRALSGHFLPTAGVAQRLTFDDGVDRDPRLNLVTGTVALPGGLQDGMRYEVTSAVTPAVPETELARTDIEPVDWTEQLELLPRPVLNLAADLTEGKDDGWPQVAAIRDKFLQDGFYDTSDHTPPGHAYSRIGEMLVDPMNIVGYDEQYAAAAAVMARVAKLPARVVVGYEVPEDRWKSGRAEVLAGDLTAWIELDAGERGWVAVDVTPDESRTPEPKSQGVTIQEVAIPNPPPPPPPPPQVEPPQQEQEEIEEEEEEEEEKGTNGSSGIGVWGWVAIGAGGIPLLLLGLFALAVIALKALRRRRRRRAGPSGQVAGAWAEVVDRCTESGAPPLRRATPSETVGVYVRQDDRFADVETELRRLAGEVDRSAFAPNPPSDEHVAVAWECSDDVAAELRRRSSGTRRVKMRLDPRPLLRDHAKAGSPR